MQIAGLGWSLAVLALTGLLVAVISGSAFLIRRDRERHRLARLDPLTGLGNRTELNESAARVLGKVDLDGDGSRGPALLLIDLDGFKEVNDILGHSAGDAVLVQVASQLQAAAGDQAQVTRLGGDEFAVLVDATVTVNQAVLQAKKLLAGLGGGGFQTRGVSLDVRASIGVALAPQHGRDLDELLRHADVAMYEAKRTRSGVRVYEPEFDPHGTDRLGSLALLRGAMDTGQLHLRYQPLVSTRTGRVSGFEALVRWDHPTRGLMLPAEFIPLVERTSMIHPLTRWTLLTAVKQASVWRSQGLDVSVAVNISAVTLEDGLLGIVDEALALTRWPADRLVLEVTESAITLNPEMARKVVTALRDKGVHVSVDDFGAGFTSLGLLGELDVRQLKIDRMFIERLGQPHHDAIVTSIIELGHRLGLSVVAEGVEAQESADRLLTLGCDELQGYHFARPMVAQDVVPWVQMLPRQRSAPAPTVPAARGRSAHVRL
ncbi:putative bifunctional diguanylate cyclase/phosphodiesterase [Thalassiella azotivora]